MGRIGIMAVKLAKHMLKLFVVLTGITLLSFSILHLSPKNPAELWLSGADPNATAISQEAIEKQEKAMGLDKPFIVQYGIWLKNAAKGDLGLSYATKKPVAQEIYNHMTPTVEMTFFSLLFTVLISVPAGILCAVRKDSAVDNFFRIISFFGISVPSFVLSLFLLWIFCIRLGLFPVIAQKGAIGIVLPSAVLTFQCASKMTRQVRAVILGELDKPYVQGAKMRGIGYGRILFSHVLLNSASPILTFAGIYVGVFLGGSAVIEGIFSVNGLGQLAVSAVARLDYNVLQGFVLWCAVVYFCVNTAVDALCALIDPRIKYSRG